MPSSSALHAVLVASALVSASVIAPGGLAAQILPTDPTTTTTTTTVKAPPPTTAVTTTTAPPGTTSMASTTTLAPTTTKPARTGGSTPTTTVAPVATTSLPPGTGSPAGDPVPGTDAPPPSLPPLSQGGGTRMNWAALISLAGFAIGFAMLALPRILHRRLAQQHRPPSRPGGPGKPPRPGKPRTPEKKPATPIRRARTRK